MAEKSIAEQLIAKEASQFANNQPEAELSTPELQSGTSLEEQFPTPIPNNIVDSTC